MSATEHCPPTVHQQAGTLPSQVSVTSFPSFSALMQGAPFKGASSTVHAARLAAVLLDRYSEQLPDDEKLLQGLRKVKAAPSPKNLLRSARWLRDVAFLGSLVPADLTEAACQLEYLAAACGDKGAARIVATEAILLAENPTTPDGEALDLACSALGWLFVAGTKSVGAEVSASARDRAADGAECLFYRVALAWRERIAATEVSSVRGFPPTSAEPKPALKGQDKLRVTKAAPEVPENPFRWTEWMSDGAEEDGDADEVLHGAVTTAPGVVVLGKVGGVATAETTRVRQALAGIVGRAVPLVPLPDLAAVRSSLVSAYPHASVVVDKILGQLVGRDYVGLAPIVLVGPPGCGKTSFAQNLLQELAIPYSLYACPTASDTALAGTPRRWQTGEPSLPLALIIEHRVASPGIILDELEKAATGTQNGRLQDALLGLMEPRSSSAWMDPYAQAPVDLSHVIWIATANSVDGIPAALRDRCRILAFPAPGPEHLPGLALSVMRRSVQARGEDPRWGEPLDGMELDLVGQAWRGGSLRVLARLLDGVTAARDLATGRH